MERIRFLSLIVPAYRQERTIVRNIRNLDKALSTLQCKYEIIVIVDGFQDNTYKKVKTLRRKRVRVIGYEKNQGKGYAVRFGVQLAKGDVIGFIDAGMDIDPEGVTMLLNHMVWYDADVIIGSKLHPVSQVNYPFARTILSWGYRNLTRFLFGFKVRDTQVGLKLFRKEVARNVFPKLLVKAFAFDVEILAVANALGYKKIYEAPIRLDFKNTSTISSVNEAGFWKVILLMLWDTFAVFYRLRIINYYNGKTKKNTIRKKRRRSW